MKHAMSLYLVPLLLQVASGAGFVLATQEELIFTDRVAPKFAFDAARALIALPFACLWLLSSEATAD